MMEAPANLSEKLGTFTDRFSPALLPLTTITTSWWPSLKGRSTGTNMTRQTIFFLSLKERSTSSCGIARLHSAPGEDLSALCPFLGSAYCSEGRRCDHPQRRGRSGRRRRRGRPHGPPRTRCSRTDCRGACVPNAHRGPRGFRDLTTDSENITKAVTTFTHPDVASSENATAVALGEKVEAAHAGAERDDDHRAERQRRLRLGVDCRLPVGQRSYQILTPPNGLPANAPSFDYFRTKVYYDKSRRGAARLPEGREPLRVGRARAAPRKISQLANGAMLDGRGRPDVPRQPRLGADRPDAEAGAPECLVRPERLDRRAARRGASRSRSRSWCPPSSSAARGLTRRCRRGSTGSTRARSTRRSRLVYHMGSNEYWGVQMTDWDDAPVLADKSLTRRIGGRIYDLYYNGPKLHMVVLRTPKARYWVVNTLLDRLSNETMIAIAQGPEAARLREEALARACRRLRRGLRRSRHRRLPRASSGTRSSCATSSRRRSTRFATAEVPIHEHGLEELLERERRAPELHDRRRGGGRGRGRRLHRRRDPADVLRRRRPLGRLDGRGRAPRRSNGGSSSR